MTRLLAAATTLVMLCGLRAIGSAADEPGKRIYEEKCLQCHGAEGRGGKGPRLVPFEWSDERVRDLIRQPVCDMPPIPESELGDEQIGQIAGYLRTIK